MWMKNSHIVHKAHEALYNLHFLSICTKILQMLSYATSEGISVFFNPICRFILLDKKFR